MHDTALENAEYFFKTYASRRSGLKVVEIGSLDVSGTLRSVAPADCEYLGLDFAEGPGVDRIVEDPYDLPVEDEFADIVVSSSCFEHSEFFWLVFAEAQRILKPDGLCYINAPSNGAFHRFPVDCWRFYPDSGIALQKWARRVGYRTTLLESFVTLRKKDQWNDFVAVFVKNEAFAGFYPDRIHHQREDYMNGRSLESSKFLRPSNLTEDQLISKNKSDSLNEISSITVKYIK